MTSVLPPLVPAADLTWRFVNAYTDAAIVRLILEQFRQDAAFTVTSCVLSLGAVVLYAVGFKRMLQLLQAGAFRVQQSARRVLPSWQVFPATPDDAASESSDRSLNLAAPERSVDEGITTGVGATLDVPPQLTMQCDAGGGDV
eukprot:jgi/Ulvmu1/8632/UM046_0035.1